MSRPVDSLRLSAPIDGRVNVEVEMSLDFLEFTVQTKGIPPMETRTPKFGRKECEGSEHKIIEASQS